MFYLCTFNLTWEVPQRPCNRREVNSLYRSPSFIEYLRVCTQEGEGDEEKEKMDEGEIEGEVEEGDDEEEDEKKEEEERR